MYLKLKKGIEITEAEKRSASELIVLAQKKTWHITRLLNKMWEKINGFVIYNLQSIKPIMSGAIIIKNKK